MYFNTKNNFYHGIMFHHFHDDKLHKQGQGSISKDDFYELIKFIGRRNIIGAEEFFNRFKENKLKSKEVWFIFASVFINLLILVNLVLKNMWGRARPNDILQFGGKESFSPWFELSNACNTNCSFVSGDAAVGFSLIILFFITKNKIFFWGSLVAGLSIGLIRILEGGHFFSDVIMSGLIVYLLTSVQFYFFKKKYAD